MQHFVTLGILHPQASSVEERHSKALDPGEAGLLAFPPLKVILPEHAHEGRELDFLTDLAKNGKEGISKPVI